MLKILIVTAILSVGLATLEIYSPMSAREQLNRTIIYTVANFGHIPFGKTLVGALYTADPLDACQFDKLKPLASTQTPFVLIKRGDCHFVKKVENAEKMGAKLAIIMDNMPENIGYLTMIDDGTGYRVKIPSILISIEDGEALRKMSQNNITMKITFETSKSDRVNLTLWLEANNRISYRLISDFANDFQKVKDYVDVKIIHHTVQCYFCKPSDCYGQGKYCSLNYDIKQPSRGKNIIQQQLRQRVVFDKYPDQWWSYMRKFDLQCTDFISASKCSQDNIFSKLDIDSAKVQSLVRSEIESLAILSSNKEYLDNGGIGSFPAVSINNMRIPGNLKSTYILEEICNTLNKPPAACSEVMDMAVDPLQPKPQYHPNYGWTIALIMVIVTIFFAIAFCMAKRFMRRRLSAEMTSQVGDMVSRYVEFYSDRAHK